jgi:signal recognition particle receptor subunit beta
MHTLTSLPPSHTLPSLVILAHKADLLPTSTTPQDTLAINRVKTVLERELQKRRASQSGGVGVEGLGAEGEKSEMGGLDTLGAAGSSFKFSEWEGGEITFLGTSSKSEKDKERNEKVDEVGLSPLRDWIDENM